MDARWSLRRLEAAVEAFSTQLQCPICLCAYDNPASLPCNHCFCEECIHRALELKQMCPICKLPARKRALRYDQMIRQLIAATEALCAPAPAAEPPAAPALPPSGEQERRAADGPLEAAASSCDAADDAAPERRARQGGFCAASLVIDELVADSEAVEAGAASPPAAAVARASPNATQPDGDKAASATDGEAAEHEAPPLNGPFATGDLVEVTDRTWRGVNKPGGTARITHVNDDGTYGVKFVIGTRREHRVHDFFLHRPPEELVADVTPSRAAKKRQRRSVADSPLANGRASAPSSDQKKKRAKRAVALATPSPVRSTPDRPKRSDLVLLCSGFEGPETDKITQWARQIGADVVLQWSSSVTHLIAKCVCADGADVAAPATPPRAWRALSPTGKRKLFADSQPPLDAAQSPPPLRDRWVKTRSLKYLKAIAAGRWVVSEHWLEACVEMGDRVYEAPYEADGHYKGRRVHDAVRRARLAREANLGAASPGTDQSSVGTQLFSRFCFHLVGEFLPPMPLAAEVESLLRIGGGRILPFLDGIPREMRKGENRARQLVVVCDKINPHTMSKEVKRLSALRPLRDPAPEAVVNYHWVINSISDAKLREFP